MVLLALALAVLAVGLLYYPGTAEKILPGQFLEKHPAFEPVETGRDCNRIEQNAETADEVAEMFDIDVDIADGKYQTACLDQCANNDETARFYCSDNQLTCVCRLYEDAG